MPNPYTKISELDVWACPECDYEHTSISATEVHDDMPLYRCVRCGSELSEGMWKQRPKPFEFYLCSRCNSWIPNMPESRFNGDLFCHSCHLPVGLASLKGMMIHELALSHALPEAISQSEKIGPDLWLIQSSAAIPERWGRIAIRYLNYHAMEEMKEFKLIRNSASLILLGSGGYLGYLSWNSENAPLPTIRQIFVVKNERRRDYGSVLVRLFRERVATRPDDSGRYFLVETPNEISARLLEKLGYAGEYGVVISP